MTKYKTYFGRYYVLTVLSLMSVLQGMAVMTFSPISVEAKDRYGLTDVQLAILPAYDSICDIFLSLPFVWFIQKYGLKVTGVSSAWFLAIGCSIRVFIPYVPEASRWIWVMHIGHILIGYAGLSIMIFPPKISSLWFRPNERALATAIVYYCQGLAGAVGFIMNTFITQQYDIRTMLYVQAELSIFIAILFTIYFPSGPPTPPSASAEEDRTSFISSFKDMVRNPGFLLLAISVGVLGVLDGFLSVLSVIFNKYTSGFNEKVAVHSFHGFITSTSWLGATSSLSLLIGGDLIGYIAGRFQRKFKLILIALLSSGCAFFVWLSLSLYGWGSLNPINLFVTFCASNFLVYATFPIYIEATVETTYPIAEETSNGVLNITYSFGSLIFTIVGVAGVFSDEHPQRARAMGWVASGAVAIALLLALFYREQYKRLSVDTGNKENSETSTLLPNDSSTAATVVNT